MSEKSMKAIDIEKLNTLVEINSLINSNYTDINALLIYMLESAMMLVKCESSSILMLHEPDNTLRFEVALGPKGVEAKVSLLHVRAALLVGLLNIIKAFLLTTFLMILVYLPRYRIKRDI